jgi:hypothetical protein
MRNIVLWGVNIGIVFMFYVLNLQDSCEPLPTEGNLIPSRTARYDVWI